MFTLFGVLSGFILVPLNAQIQSLSATIHLGTILAANNFVQNIFMFSFLVLTTIFAYFGMDAQLLFYLMGFVGLYLFYLLFKRYYRSMFWSVMEIITSVRHRYEYIGLENIPDAGAVLLLGNHVSWVDWIMLQLPIKRPINFMIDKRIYHWKFFHLFFKKGETIPLSPRAFKDAFKEAHRRLQEGRIVGIFPEGGISKNGSFGTFHRGFELIEKDYEGVIVPFYIDSGIFGSIFSKYKGKNAKLNFFKRRVVRICFHKPVPIETTAQELQNILEKMREEYETK
jgi:acyl-[acyl-carrier-protein]-phospholipid O-acyltransferase/long-chain-fatty-acid--[acyl-carrier-protein] ligase